MVLGLKVQVLAILVKNFDAFVTFLIDSYESSAMCTVFLCNKNKTGKGRTNGADKVSTFTVTTSQYLGNSAFCMVQEHSLHAYNLQKSTIVKFDNIKSFWKLILDNLKLSMLFMTWLHQFPILSVNVYWFIKILFLWPRKCIFLKYDLTVKEEVILWQLFIWIIFTLIFKNTSSSDFNLNNSQSHLRQ